MKQRAAGEMPTFDEAVTPSNAREKEQQEAARWRHFAGSAQTALILGSDLDPNGIHDWLTECNRLADKLMSPNATVQAAGGALSARSPGTAS